MIEEYNRYKVLQEFFKFPRKDFQVRELSRRIKLAPVSVANHLKYLSKEDLVIKENKYIYSTFKASRDNETFKLLKKQNTILRIHNTGLLTHLEETLKPNCIILFGSASRGEDIESSDIDIFIQSKESILNRKISLLFEPNIKRLNKELLNNLINSEVLYGYLKVF